MSATTLGPGAEFDVIRRMLSRWGDRASGVGDDAAVLVVPRGDKLIASVDSAIEGRHFRAEWLSPAEIGYRAVAAALSDVAAMAAHPIGVLIAIGLAPTWREQLDAIADGIGDAVSSCGTKILGGNLSAAHELSITTTVLGSAFSPLARSGAKAGDHVYVTGRLGGAGHALSRLRAGDAAGPHRDRLARPLPRITESHWLADAGASSAIDISDGLAADAKHVAAASGVELRLDAARVPCADGVSSTVAVTSGEEYELLVTSPHALDAAEFESRFRIPLTDIGRVVAGSPGAVYIHGVPDADLVGHDHFSA